MSSKISYSIEKTETCSYYYPIIRAIIDGKRLDYYFITAGLEYSSKNEGVVPLLNCSCGLVGCGGAYVFVKHTENTIIWDSIYPKFYEFDKTVENDKRINNPKYELKLLNKKTLKLPLVFSKQGYRDIFEKLMSDDYFQKYEYEQYLRDSKMFSEGNFFYP